VTRVPQPPHLAPRECLHKLRFYRRSAPEIVSGPPMHVGHVTSQPHPGTEPGAPRGAPPPEVPPKGFWRRLRRPISLSDEAAPRFARASSAKMPEWTASTSWWWVWGPAGASAALHWLAEAGHHVVVVEKKRFPREKTCGDGLTPRAVRQLNEMGLAERLEEYHRFVGLRSMAHGLTLEAGVAEPRRLPGLRLRVTRRNLDEMVADQAVKARGDACARPPRPPRPLVENGLVTGAIVTRKGQRHDGTGPGPLPS